MSVDNVADITPRIQYVASAAQTDFDYPFPVFSQTDIVVDVDGVTKTITTHYTVDGVGDDAGGTVTFLSAMAGGEIVTIYRDMAIERLTDFQQHGPYSSDSFNDELDRITLILQELKSNQGRSLRFPVTSEVTSDETEFDPIANWLDKYIYIDANGVPEPAAGVSSVTLTQSVIGGLLNPQTTAESSAGVSPTALYQRYIDVARQGATGDGATDDTAAIQAAFNAARYGLSRIHFPSLNRNGQTIYLCSEIEVYEGAHVTADEGVLIQKNAGSATSHIFDMVSTLGTATALTANTAKRDASVAVTSAAGLSVGQVVVIRDTQYKFGTSGRNLEFNEITDITGLTITLKNRLLGAYLTASTAELVPVTVPARKIKFENVRCLIPSDQDGGGFYFQEAYDCELVNCESKGQKGQAGCMAWRSAYVRVFGGDYSDGQSQSTPGYGYGVAFSQSSHNCVAVGIRTRNVRENAISLGSRFCFFIDCEAHSTYDNSFNTHADGNEDCGFINCRSYFARSKGFYAGGVTAQAPDKRIRFLNCENHYSGYFGFWADGASGIESEDIEFNGCKDFHSGDDTATSYGFYLFRSTRPRMVNCTSDADGETNIRACVKAEICTDAEIKRNKLRGHSGSWGIIHANCTGVQIDDNEIGNVGSNQAVHAESTDSTKVYVRRNHTDNDVNFTRVAGDILIDNEWDTKRQHARGSTSVADGGTIAHGLITTPTSVRAVATTANEFVSVTAKAATTFTVAIKKHDSTAGTTANVDWEANYD